MFDTSRLSGTYTWCVFSLLGPLLSGCGSDSSNTNGNGSGQVTDEWRDFCVAKFTKDVAIRDFGDEVSFTAKTGEEYLLTTYGSFGSAPKVEIAYLTTAGPKTYEV